MKVLLDTHTFLNVATEKYTLALVSFDSDFDHTERGRKTLAEAL
jgi:predicted nucleic acid-binding protein